MPGTRIPILPLERLAETRPDYVLILPVEPPDEIVATSLRTSGSGAAEFVVPIPALEVVE